MSIHLLNLYFSFYLLSWLNMTPYETRQESKVSTIQDCVLSDRTCDYNGTYNRTNKVKRNYYVVVDENSDQAVKWVHKSKDGYFYKKRVSRWYIDVVAYTKDIYTLDRYYRHINTVPGLKIIVIRAISAHNEYVYPYFCVVYSLKGAKPDEVVEISCTPYGNSKQSIKNINLHKPICFGRNGQFTWKRHFTKCFSSTSEWVRRFHLFHLSIHWAKKYDATR